MRLLFITLLILTPALAPAHAGVAAVDDATCPCCAPVEGPVCGLASQDDGRPCGPSCTCFEHLGHWVPWGRSKSADESAVGRLPDTRTCAFGVDSRSAAGGVHRVVLAGPRRLADFLGVLLI